MQDLFYLLEILSGDLNLEISYTFLEKQKENNNFFSLLLEIYFTRNVILELYIYFFFLCGFLSLFRFSWCYCNMEDAAGHKGVYKSDYSDNDWDWRQQ